MDLLPQFYFSETMCYNFQSYHDHVMYYNIYMYITHIMNGIIMQWGTAFKVKTKNAQQVFLPILF